MSQPGTQQEHQAMEQDNTTVPENPYQVPASFSQKTAWLMRVLADPNLSDGAKVVATRLRYYHNDTTGQCNPRQGVLAGAVGKGRQKVNEYVADLISSGWISTQTIKGRGCLYRLEVERMEALSVDRKPRRPQPKRKEVSPVRDTTCPVVTTPPVAGTGHGGVAGTGHRTFKGKDPEKREIQPLPEPANDASPKSSPSSSGSDDFVRINGMSLPEETFKGWVRAYPHIKVHNEVAGIVDWLGRKRIPENEHLSRIEAMLAKKDSEAHRKDREARITAEANAKHAARPRGAAI